MAKIELFRWKHSDEPDEVINLTAAVGATKAENHPDDVTVVQGLLLYLNPWKRGFAKGKGPEWPHGTFDDATRWAIEQYQKHVNSRPRSKWRIIEDGRISPARGKYAFGRDTYMWTISSLNHDALEEALLAGHSQNYIAHLCRMYSEVKGALKA
jgi:hypothetical protein